LTAIQILETNSESLVSIIIPAYQAEKTIVSTVNSVLSQTYPYWELLIVADDLQDYQSILTRQNISDPRIKYLSTKKIRSNASNARNIGLQKATGNYIAFLDADDRFMPQKLELAVPLLREYPLISTGIRLLTDENILLMDVGCQVTSGAYPIGKFKFINYSGNANIIYDRGIIRHQFDTSYNNFADVIFIFEAAQYTTAFYHLSDSMYDYVQYRDSLSKSEGVHHRLIRLKQILIKKLEQQEYPLISESTRNDFIHFLKISREAESVLLAARERNESLSFERIIKKMLLADPATAFLSKTL